MGQERLPVRKIREVLRLKAEGFSDRQIAAAIGSARSTVQECVRRARDAGIAWPLAPALDGARIVQKKNRHSSGCDPMVVAEHSAEALSALNRVMG